MESKERIAYLKGLLDGLRPQDETQVKVYAAIVDALEALADETEMHADELHEQAEMVEELNEFCESLEDDMEDFFELMEQDEAKEDFLSPMMREQMKSVMRCAFNENCLQLAFLEIGGHKAAAYLSFDFLNRIWVYNSGLDRRYMEYSPGWVLLGYLVQWAIQHGRQEFDFMRGDEDYKYKFGAVDRYVMRATIKF